MILFLLWGYQKTVTAFESQRKRGLGKWPRGGEVIRLPKFNHKALKSCIIYL